MTDPVPDRVVRVLAECFVLLDEQLPAERGPNGEPTAAEFAASDLLDIVDTFARSWDELPMPHPGRPNYRVLIVTTHLVYARGVAGPAVAGRRRCRVDRHRYRPRRLRHRARLGR